MEKAILPMTTASNSSPSLPPDITHALIDGLDLPDLAGLIGNRHDRQDTGLYTGQMAVDYELHMPRLVALDDSVWEWLQPIVESDAQWGIALRLRPEYLVWDEAEQLHLLVEHWREWTSIITPESERWLFRFYSPTVIQTFFRYATTPEQASLLGPCESITLIDQQWQPLTLSLETMPETAMFRPHPIAPLRAGLLQGMHTASVQHLLNGFKAHLREHHAVARAWDDATLDAFTLDGARLAWQHGFQNESDMARFLSLQAVLGADFIQNPAYPWVRPILMAQESSGVESRMDKLYAQALQHMTA